MFILTARSLNYVMLKFIPNLFIIGIAFLTACSSSTSTQMIPAGNTDSLAGLQAIANSKVVKKSSAQAMGKIREMAIKETALSLGAQSALAWRAKIIDQSLNEQARNLDALYDFNALVLEHNVLPPVLVEGRNTLNLADTQTIRISDRTYKVVKQARFITAAPNWRQYLWMDYKQPSYPDLTLLPKTLEEKQIWYTNIEKGWNNGIEQASTIFAENVARIKEDFTGMILYRKLLAMNMVSPPYVSHTDLGVTGDTSEIHIDDRVLRITALPALNTNSQEWRAAVAADENALEQFNNMEKLANNTPIMISNKSWQPIISPIN